MLAMLFQNYKLTLVAEQHVMPFYGVVMPAANGTMYMVEKI